MSVKRFCFIFCASLLCLNAAACGKRGNLEYPGNAAPRRTYPAPRSPAAEFLLPSAVEVPEPAAENPAMQEQVLDNFESNASAVDQTVAPADF